MKPKKMRVWVTACNIEDAFHVVRKVVMRWVWADELRALTARERGGKAGR